MVVIIIAEGNPLIGCPAPSISSVNVRCVPASNHNPGGESSNMDGLVKGGQFGTGKSKKRLVSNVLDQVEMESSQDNGVIKFVVHFMPFVELRDVKASMNPIEDGIFNHTGHEEMKSHTTD